MKLTIALLTILIAASSIGCTHKPRFKVGDCIKIDYHVSEFSEHAYYAKIIAVGKEHYLLTTFGENLIESIDDYSELTSCDIFK